MSFLVITLLEIILPKKMHVQKYFLATKMLNNLALIISRVLDLFVFLLFVSYFGIIRPYFIDFMRKIIN